MSEFIVVYITTGSEEEGEKLAHTLVAERLAACVNRVSGVHSTYFWQGRIENSDEELLVVKTSRELFDRLAERVRELHGYTVPEVIALPLVEGSEDYLSWMRDYLTRR